jgi:hypothetical protein
MKRITQPVLSLVILCLVAVAPTMQAVVPPPDGGYPNFNTAEGQNALFSLTFGSANTAVGWFSLWGNAEGNFNTGTGAGALLFNTADENTAFGAAALLFNTTGFNNTAVGAAALLNNTLGLNNTAVGANALFGNSVSSGDTTTGGPSSANTAVGSSALFNNSTGSFNTAHGNDALLLNTTGSFNTGNGAFALFSNTTGTGNTALGNSAGSDVTGDGNVCIGQGVIGVAGVDDTTWIRNVNTTLQNFAAGVNDYVTVRLSDGRLGHTAVVSSQRYKEDIKALAAASEALYGLKPVSFRLKREYDETQALGFGLIAEEVEKVNPDLVYRNDKGQAESVRYEMVNAMLLNEFLKEHRRGEEQDCKIQEQETTIAELRSEIRSLAVMVSEQASELRKVSAQLQISNAAAQGIARNRP